MSYKMVASEQLDHTLQMPVSPFSKNSDSCAVHGCRVDLIQAAVVLQGNVGQNHPALILQSAAAGHNMLPAFQSLMAPVLPFFLLHFAIVCLQTKSMAGASRPVSVNANTPDAFGLVDGSASASSVY